MGSDGLFLRRVFQAPDDPFELLATSNKSCVIQIRCGDPSLSAPFIVPETASSPRVKLPFPPTSISWCPLKNGAENACFLTSCKSQPLQLWDLEDATQRASYIAYNDSGLPAHAFCTLWLGKPHTGLIAGGYGGFEDKHHVRFYDVLYEGSNAVLSYRSGVDSAVGATCTLANGPCRLVLSSYHKVGVVEAIDIRNRCPALMLRKMHENGAACIRAHPTNEYHVYVSGYKGSEYIYAWDLRRCLQPIALFQREAQTHQICDFSFLRPVDWETSNSGWLLVSSTSAGGFLVFKEESETHSGCVVHATRRCGEQLGATGALAALPNGRLVVCLAHKGFFFERSRTRGALQSTTEGVAPPVECAENSKHDDREFDDTAVPLSWQANRKRLREPLSDTDMDTECENSSGDNSSTASNSVSNLNAVIVSL